MDAEGLQGSDEAPPQLRLVLLPGGSLGLTAIAEAAVGGAGKTQHGFYSNQVS